ncbi:MAG: hypothetical protein KDA35_10595, partial [Hyphomonadaceae bacterium]|nr:hypothetical protein [Hyphomonadaceae bacterium]
MSLTLVERHGYTGSHAPVLKEREVTRARIHRQVFRTRRRSFQTNAAGIETLSRLLTAAATELGPHWAADLFLQAELEFWMSRCQVGRVRHAKQTEAGVGWAAARQFVYACSRDTVHKS